MDSPVHAAQGCVIRDAPFRNAQGPGNIADRPLEWGSPVTDGLLRLADTNPHGFGYSRAEGGKPHDAFFDAVRDVARPPDAETYLREQISEGITPFPFRRGEA